MMRLLYFLIILLVFASCQTYTHSVVNRDVAEMYNPGKTSLHPEFKVQIKNDSTANLLVRVLRNELLYSRANAEGKLKSAIEIHCRVFSDMENLLLYDSVTVSREVSFSQSPLVISVVKLNIQPEKWHNVQIRVSDTYRQRSYNGFTVINNSKQYAGQRMYTTILPMNTEKAAERLAFYPWVPDSFAVKLYVPQGGTVGRTYVSAYWDDQKLPPLPFAEFGDSLSMQPDTVIRLQGGLFMPQERGMYFFSPDTSKIEGVGMVMANTHYPEMKQTADLIRPLEYLCSPEEFQAIKSRKNYKLALDEFWIASTRDYLKAKQMIRIYYNRVRYANIYFTSVREGWRTDRGMIFLLFGPPEKVFRTDYGEQWLYGTAPQYRSLTFDFEYVDNPYSVNHFQLRRRADYRSAWKYAVKQWRTGIVYNGEEKIATQMYEDSKQIQ